MTATLTRRTSRSTLLAIPEEHTDTLPCRTDSELFTTSDLDVDVHDEDYLALSPTEQARRHANKAIAEAHAVAACHTCPILDTCRDWALSTNVFGVAGGLTDTERREATRRDYTLTDTTRGPRGTVRDDLVDAWTRQGLTASRIADRLECTTRTVERRRTLIAARGITYNPIATTPPAGYTPVATAHRLPTPDTAPAPAPAADTPARPATTGEHTTARRPLNPDTMTPETLAMYLALADGAYRDRDTVIDAALHLVDTDTAASWGRNLRGTDADRIAAGRRKFLMNRLDIASRRGRIHIDKQGRQATCHLDPEACTQLTAWIGTRTAA